MLSFKNVFKGEQIPCMSAGMRMPHPDSYIPVGCAIGVIMKLLKPRTLLEEVPSWRRLCEFIALPLPFPSPCFWHKVEVISAPSFSFHGSPATVDIWPWGIQIQTEPSLSRNCNSPHCVNRKSEEEMVFKVPFGILFFRLQQVQILARRK